MASSRPGRRRQAKKEEENSTGQRWCLNYFILLALGVLLTTWLLSHETTLLSGSIPISELARAALIDTTSKLRSNANATTISASSTAITLLERQTVTLQSQDILNNLIKGEWISRNTSANSSSNRLPRNALGSLSRFASCQAFQGPHMDLAHYEISEETLIEMSKQVTEDNTNATSQLLKFSAPHSVLATSTLNLMPDGGTCEETDWILDSNNNPLQWKTQQQAQQLLQGRWIAFWGDSTTRLLFSALIHLLQGSIETYLLPTHDFGHGPHWQTFDHCNERTKCNLAVYIPSTNTMITFRFVTRIESWPEEVEEAMQEYSTLRPEFFQNNYSKEFPDVVFLNDGPWEFYSYGGRSEWSDDREEVYRKDFARFLQNNFASPSWRRLVVLQNSACPAQGACEASGGYTCVDAMAKMAKIQETVLQELQLPTIRYVPLMESFPTKYNCQGEGYHLPGLMTDMRLNLLLEAIVE